MVLVKTASIGRSCHGGPPMVPRDAQSRFRVFYPGFHGGAGDGNRNRVTSLEVRSPGLRAELRRCRSWSVGERRKRPWLTLAYGTYVVGAPVSDPTGEAAPPGPDVKPGLRG
jgi:hypothetical protein